MLFRQQHRVRKVAFKQKVRTSTRVMIRENQCERILRFGASSLWFFHKLRVIASSMSSVSTGSPRENMYPFKLEGAAIDGDPSGVYNSTESLGRRAAPTPLPSSAKVKTAGS